jgi:hypothetical protein
MLDNILYVGTTILDCANSQKGADFIYTAAEFDVTTVRGRLKCDGTRAETIFPVSEKKTNPFKSAGVSVQSTTGS